jgi:hypothetical protein
MGCSSSAAYRRTSQNIIEIKRLNAEQALKTGSILG